MKVLKALSCQMKNVIILGKSPEIIKMNYIIRERGKIYKENYGKQNINSHILHTS